jgi:hypothetical protein
LRLLKDFEGLQRYHLLELLTRKGVAEYLFANHKRLFNRSIRAFTRSMRNFKSSIAPLN